MEHKELVKQLREHLADKEGIDGKAAPALHLMRHALVALERPIVEVRQDVLEDNHEAEQLRDQLAERDGFIYGLLGELQLIPEVDGEPVDTLADAIAEDFDILESLHSEIVQMFSQWNGSPDAVKDQSKFITAVRNLLQLDADTPLMDVWSELEAKALYLSSLEGAVADRDRTIDEMERGQQIVDLASGRNKPHQEHAGEPADQWRDDALDLAHAVAKDKSLGNRVMAKAAEQLIADARGIPNG